MKKSVLILGLLFAGLLLPRKASAQGTFTCTWNGAECVTGVNNCLWNPPSECYVPIEESIYCNQFPSTMCSSQSSTCVPDPSCANPANPPPGRGDCLDTAIGCIDIRDPTGLVTSIMGLAIGIAGGIAFLLMIVGTIQALSSSGNPEKISAGQQMITSAIAGLLLIVFAVFILRVIGKDILGIFQ